MEHCLFCTQYVVVAYKFDCALWSMEGFPSAESNDVVALWNTYIDICCFPRSASGFILESLQVS